MNTDMDPTDIDTPTAIESTTITTIPTITMDISILCTCIVTDNGFEYLRLFGDSPESPE